MIEYDVPLDIYRAIDMDCEATASDFEVDLAIDRAPDTDLVIVRGIDIEVEI